MDQLAAAVNFTGYDLASFVQVVSLIVLPFAHEDLAIVLGAYIVVNDLMPVGLVAASIYGGMVVSDFALYGIGAGARHLPWLRRHAVDGRLHGFADVLKRNVFALVALCRFVPGVVFVAFVACGWARVSLARFTVASLLVSALYLPVMLYLVIVFGDALDDHIGFWTWPILMAAIVLAALARERILAFGGALAGADNPSGAPPIRAPNLAGLPPLEGLTRKVAVAERIPPLVFSIPLFLHWIMLGLRYRSFTLPSAANPAIPTGGMWGYSKSECLAQVPEPERAAIAEFVVLRRRADPSSLPVDHARALRLLGEAGLAFPVVAKPDIGVQGFGVRLIADAAALQAYLEKFPAGAKLMLQRYVPHAGEAAVLYARAPGVERGRVLALALTYFPHVTGDGASTLRELIARDPRARRAARLHVGRHQDHLGLDSAALDAVPAQGEIVRLALIGSRRVGALTRDASASITPALDARIDAIARGMPDFHYGRFDLRFVSLDALLRGEKFSIVEINGVGSEAVHAWDPAASLGQTWRRLIDQQRVMFMIGACNRARGIAPTGVAEFLGRFLQQADLLRRYPASS